jgi:outer membrane protein OmpA-like peptidoglycan-associated protein
VTSKGIWSAGLLALGAVAAFCIWQHAPSISASTASSAPIAPIADSTKAIVAAGSAGAKSVLPPAVTGPTSSETSRMPSGDSINAVPRIETPASKPPKLEPKVEAPKVEAPKVEAPKVEAPKIETPKLDSPIVVAPKVEPPSAIVPSMPTTKARSTFVKVKKKRVVVANRGAKGCEFKRDNAVVRSICFNFNSARLTTASKAKLNAIIPKLKQSNQFELNGFADSVGSKAYNSDLSERRSKAVLKYLVSKGVDANKVAVKSFGSDSAEKQRMGKSQLERRVDVRVVP